MRLSLESPGPVSLDGRNPQLLTWAATTAIARILQPADYGIVAMAVVFTGSVSLINEFGLGAGLIQSARLGGGRVLGTQAVGAYLIASLLTGLIADRLSIVLSQEVYPILAEGTRRTRRARTLLHRWQQLPRLSVPSFPTAAGLLLSNEFIFAARGAIWQQVIQPLRVLAIYGAYQSVTAFAARAKY